MDKNKTRISLYLDKEEVRMLKRRAVNEDKKVNRYLVHASNMYEKSKTQLKKS
jgi:hypothetical protein